MSAIELPYLTKPLKGSPCNGCGLCCAQEVCEIGIGILGSVPPPCPLLVYREGRTFCGAVEQGTNFSRIMFKRLLGIGKGCCSEDELCYDIESESAAAKSAAG